MAKREHADGDDAEVSLDLSRVPCRHHTAEAARAGHGFIDPDVDAAFVEISAENSKELPESGESSHETVPEMTIHPVGDTRGHSAPRDDGPVVNFVQPHFVFEKVKQCGLRVIERIRLWGTMSIFLAGFAIHDKAESDADSDERERNEQHRLD